jgi:transcriptional regulator with XRE-family HTH domain
MENLLLCCLRLQAGLSTSQLARHLGITVSAYLDIENGRAELTRPYQDKLTKVFKVSPEILKVALVQSELFRASAELIKHQEWVIEMLTALVRTLAQSPKHTSQ